MALQADDTRYGLQKPHHSHNWRDRIWKNYTDRPGPVTLQCFGALEVAIKVALNNTHSRMTYFLCRIDARQSVLCQGRLHWSDTTAEGGK